jgi:hypothetical protein
MLLWMGADPDVKNLFKLSPKDEARGEVRIIVEGDGRGERRGRRRRRRRLSLWITCSVLIFSGYFHISYFYHGRSCRNW